MTSYQVSPPKKEVKKVGREESDTPAFLILGAFCATPKLHYETVILGQEKKRSLVIRNPTDSHCFLKFLKRPSAVFALSYSSEDQEDLLVPSSGEVIVTITWKPKEEGQCFEVFQVQPSIGGSRLSVHLLGKCLPPPKKVGVKKRPFVAPGSVAALPKPNDPALKLNSVGRNPSLRPSTKVTVPVSPKFSTRFGSKSETAAEDLAKGSGDFAFVTPSVNKVLLQSPTPLEKLGSLSLPFTPEPVQRVVHMMSLPVEVKSEGVEEMDSALPKVDPQQTFILPNDLQPANFASPSRRETYLVAPTPRSSVNVPQNNNGSDVPPLESFGSESTENNTLLDTSTGIELDPTVVDSIAKALDNELGFMHSSVDTILNEVDQMGSKQHAAAVAAFSRLTELDEESIMNDPTFFDEDDAQLAAKAVSGEFLCVDQMDLVPNFPTEEPSSESELAASIKQLLKDGVSDEDILARFAESDSMVREIRALYGELSEKYKSCKECYEIAKTAHLSESFTFNRIVIQKAIKNGEIRFKPGADICCFKSKTRIISQLLSSFNRPWLWSALCLVFHDDKLVADDIDMMNFIDENLFWNDENLDYFENGGGPTPKEFLDSFLPKFLQNYLEIIYLLDATAVPAVYVPNHCTKKCLEVFQTEFLEDTDLTQVLDRIPIQIAECVDPVQYIVQENLRGPNLLAWTNLVKLVEELVNQDSRTTQPRPELTIKSSRVDAARESLEVAIEELDKLGFKCQPPSDELNWLLHGCHSIVDEKLIWQLVLRIRISQGKNKKLQGSEE